MANNLKVFNTNSEYQSADLVHPAVSYVIETDKVIYEPTPPTPSFKWKATYSDSHVESAQCGSSSEITSGEINKTNLVSVEIGDCVTSIGEGAFQYCSSLTSVTIPNSVTNIGRWAFYSCRGLTSINIPSGVTSIGDSAFGDCTSLSSINIPSGVTSINYQAFASCSSLTSIDIPDSVTSIGGSAFQYCTSLTSIDIPNSVTSIGDSVFQFCDSLTSCTIGNGVTSIDGFAFFNCKSLTSVTVNAVTPPTLGDYAFDSTSNDLVIYVPCESVNAYKAAWSRYASRITCIQPSFKWKVTFSDDTTSSGACSSNTELTYTELPLDRFVKLEVGDCCTIVSTNFSSKLSGVTSATISDSVTKIGIRMFNDCSKLKTVEVGSGVTRIDDWFVNSCTALTSVTIKATTPPRLGNACFTNSNNCPIYVPSQSVQAYKSATNWSSYASRIQPIP